MDYPNSSKLQMTSNNFKTEFQKNYVEAVLKDSIVLLCKNELKVFCGEGFRIEGLLAITSNKNNNIFLVHIDKLIDKEEFLESGNDKRISANSFHKNTNSAKRNCKQNENLANKIKKRSSSEIYNLNDNGVIVLEDENEEYWEPETEQHQIKEENFNNTNNCDVYKTLEFLKTEKYELTEELNDIQVDEFDTKRGALWEEENYFDNNFQIKTGNMEEKTKKKKVPTARSGFRQSKSLGSTQSSQSGSLKQTNQSSYVVTRSFHECGYPNCGKQFQWKQHLLRHQTKKHGRTPTKSLALKVQRVWTKNNPKRNFPDDQSNYCDTDVNDQLNYCDTNDPNLETDDPSVEQNNFYEGEYYEEG